MSLFPLHLTRRVELRTRDEQLTGPNVPARVLRKGERVDVLDILTTGFYCQSRYGRVLLAPDALRPARQTTTKGHAA